MRERAGVAAGDEVDVLLELDTEPREVALRADLAEALRADETAASAYEALSYSRRQRLVLPIDDAKSPQARARRVLRAVEALREGVA